MFGHSCQGATCGEKRTPRGACSTSPMIAGSATLVRRLGQLHLQLHLPRYTPDFFSLPCDLARRERLSDNGQSGRATSQLQVAVPWCRAATGSTRLFPHDAAEADVTGRRIDHLRIARGWPIPRTRVCSWTAFLTEAGGDDAAKAMPDANVSTGPRYWRPAHRALSRWEELRCVAPPVSA